MIWVRVLGAHGAIQATIATILTSCLSQLCCCSIPSSICNRNWWWCHYDLEVCFLLFYFKSFIHLHMRHWGVCYSSRKNPQNLIKKKKRNITSHRFTWWSEWATLIIFIPLWWELQKQKSFTLSATLRLLTHFFLIQVEFEGFFKVKPILLQFVSLWSVNSAECPALVNLTVLNGGLFSQMCEIVKDPEWEACVRLRKWCIMQQQQQERLSV